MDDHTVSVTVARNAKKKAGYTVEERDDGGYYIAEAPAKARVNPGDKVMMINGIKADEFVDADDANDLIESIRLVVVPEDVLEDYDAQQEAQAEANNNNEEDNDAAADRPEEEEEMNNAPPKKSPKNKKSEKPASKKDKKPGKKNRGGDDDDGEEEEAPKKSKSKKKNADDPMSPKGKKSKDKKSKKGKDGNPENQLALIPFENEADNNDNDNNDDDDDGKNKNKKKNKKNKDKGTPQENKSTPPVESTALVVHQENPVECDQCGHINKNPQPDEDGEYNCEECGSPLDIAPQDQKPKDVYHCENCGYDNVNPERDEQGDLVCDNCGEVLPEEEDQRPACPQCGHKNDDPKARQCEECGADMGIDDDDEEDEEPKSKSEKLQNIQKDNDDNEEEYDSAQDDSSEEPKKQQEFDENGKPLTNKDGKKLTPADMFQPGDVITVTVGKSNPKQDAGLKVEERNGKYYVRKVPSSGLFCKTPVIAGDKILELNGVDSKDYKHINQMKKTIKEAPRITVVVLRRDPEASESSASTDIDFDNLEPVQADGTTGGDTSNYGPRDDNSVPYDGHDCGCVWCPECS